MSVRSKSLMIAIVSALALGVLADAGQTGAQTFAGQKRISKAQQQLFSSVRNNDLAGVRASLDVGADVFATDGMGNRAADIAVDLGLFDIAHYLLSVMDHKRRVEATKNTPVGDELLAAPSAPVAAAPVTAPQVSLKTSPKRQPVPAPAPAPVVSGPNPFDVKITPVPPQAPAKSPEKPNRSLAEILNAPSNPSVNLAQPTVKMAAAPPSQDPTAQAKVKPAPVDNPQSRLHVPLKAEGEQTAPESIAKPAPIVASKPDPQPAPQTESKPAPKLYVAPQPTSSAAAQPAATKPEDEPKDQAGWFEKMTSFFKSDEADPAPESTPGLAPEPKPAATPKQTVAMAQIQDPPPSQVQPRRPEVKRGIIALTPALVLGKEPPAKPQTAASLYAEVAEWPCVSKGRWGIVCLEQATWSTGLAPHFDGMRTNLYRGSKAVVGYENGQADFIYAVFPSTSFDAVVEDFSQRLGTPDLVTQRGVRPFQKTLEPNPVRTWYGYDEEAGREVVLEVSRYDDNRRTFPVMTEGSLKLTYVGEDSIFRYTAPIELQRLN